MKNIVNKKKSVIMSEQEVIPVLQQEGVKGGAPPLCLL
jgi:hypothetical protein